MSSTNEINRSGQPDPTSEEYWGVSGSDGLAELETGLSPEEQAKLTKKKDDLNRLLLRMSTNNSGRAKIEEELQSIETQLKAGDIGSDWGDEKEDLGTPAVNSKYASEDTSPTSIDKNKKIAIYESKPTKNKDKKAEGKKSEGEDEIPEEPESEDVIIHTDPGNKDVKTYQISRKGIITLFLGEDKKDTAKVELVDKQYVFHLKGAKGEETYKIDADKVKSIQLQNADEDKIDLSSLKPYEKAKIQIGDKDPEWLQGLTTNLPMHETRNLEEATNLIKKMAEAGKSGDWEPVKDFLKKDPSMKTGESAGNVLLKVLSTVVEPVLSKVVNQVEPYIAEYVKKGGNQFGRGVNPRDDTLHGNAIRMALQTVLFMAFFMPNGTGNGAKVIDAGLGLDWADSYNNDIRVRDSIDDNVQKAKREAIRFRLDKISSGLKSEIIDTLKCLPIEVRQIIAEKLPNNDEDRLGSRFSNNEWKSLVTASLAE